jgi:hypothetical protein
LKEGIVVANDPTKSSSSKKPRRIKVEEAVGLPLAHDITEVRPGEFKGPSFRKGYRIREKDLCHLMRLGKRHLYVLDPDEDQVHEDDAAIRIAEALAGPGVTFVPHPREGKIQLEAAQDGLFKVNVEHLVRFNLMPDMMCASIHNDTPVRKGEKLAGTRIIPLFTSREVLTRAIDLARSGFPVFSVRPFRRLRARLIITGSEVYEGLIEDRFEAIVREKLEAHGSSLVETIVLPDDVIMIAQTIALFLGKGTDLLITTGGMSVDPDDVTRVAIARTAVDRLCYGAAVLPGAMFLLAYRGDIPIVGIPACALYHQTTVFDLILPRLLVGEQPEALDLARLAHGGLCRDCPSCRFPACSFGKSGNN